MNMNDLKSIIAKNIIKFRKQAGLTQLELAEKLSYSDKAVSKWERGDCIPDVCVLKQMAELFQISVEVLISEEVKHTNHFKINLSKRALVSSCSALACWVLATFMFFLFQIININLEKQWLIFIYAIPLTFAVLSGFSISWKRKVLTCIFISLFLWFLALAISLTISTISIWWIFIVCVPIQAILIVWSILKK